MATSTSSGPPLDLKIQKGPCIACGNTDYPLSMGGPAICPACDSQPPKRRVGQLAAENRRLRELLSGDELSLRLQRQVDAAGGVPADVPLWARVDCLIKQRDGRVGLAPGNFERIAND